MSFTDQLRGCELFIDITDGEIDFLLKGADVIHADKGVRIIAEGERIDHFFIVLSGKADIIKNMNTEIIHVQKLKKMDHYGELIFSNIGVSPFEIISTSNFTALKITFERFQAMYKKKPEAYGIFLMNLLRIELEKNKIQLGLIARLYTEGNVDIGFPLFGNRRLSQEEIISKKQNKMRAHWASKKKAS